MRVWLLVLALATFLPAIAEQASSPTPAPTPGKSSTDDLDQVVCKKIGPPTGSHLGGHTVCQTKKRWQELEQSSRDALQKAQNSACVGPGCG